MKLKIFWKENCPDCPKAKRIGEMINEKIEVQYCNIDTIEGLSEACMMNVMSTPSIILLDNDNNEMEAWRGVVPEYGNIKEKISS